MERDSKISRGRQGKMKPVVAIERCNAAVGVRHGARKGVPFPSYASLILPVGAGDDLELLRLRC